MLRRHDHIGRPPECIGARRKNRQQIARGGSKIKFGAGTSADPIALLGVDPLNKVNFI